MGVEEIWFIGYEVQNFEDENLVTAKTRLVREACISNSEVGNQPDICLKIQ
jgi:hypothetical protein